MDIVGILQWVVVGIATIGISKIVLIKVNNIIIEFFAKLRNDITKQIDIKLKDPEFREIAYKAIVYAQKTFGDLTGFGRLQKAITFAQKIIPTTIDDAIVEGAINQIYEEIMKPIKKEKEQ